jgi:hypothetical protein
MRGALIQERFPVDDYIQVRARRARGLNHNQEPLTVWGQLPEMAVVAKARGHPYRFLVHDRDSIFSKDLTSL